MAAALASALVALSQALPVAPENAKMIALVVLCVMLALVVASFIFLAIVNRS